MINNNAVSTSTRVRVRFLIQSSFSSHHLQKKPVSTWTINNEHKLMMVLILLMIATTLMILMLIYMMMMTMILLPTSPDEVSMVIMIMMIMTILMSLMIFTNVWPEWTSWLGLWPTPSPPTQWCTAKSINQLLLKVIRSKFLSVLPTWTPALCTSGLAP